MERLASFTPAEPEACHCYEPPGTFHLCNVYPTISMDVEFEVCQAHLEYLKNS